METMEAVRKRRSIRSFKDEAVPDEALNDILEAGRLAPSALNAQNWRFGVVTDKPLRHQLVGAAGGQAWIDEAPVLIALCVQIDQDIKDKHHDDPEVRVTRARYGGRLIDYVNKYDERPTMNALLHSPDVLLAGQQMQLVAVDHGLATCWISYMDIQRVSKLLHLPENVVCTYLIALGYPAGKPDPVERAPLEKLIFRDVWQGDPHEGTPHRIAGGD
jgi:nitroreductase